MKPLSEKQQQILAFIEQFSAREGYPPSVREICAAVGLRSPSTVHAHLRVLTERGLLNRGDAGKKRTLTLPGESVMRVPILGNVAAGVPILAEENIEGYLPMECSGASGEHFALHVRGDSMIDAGILNGDLIVVRRQETAENGEIVVALIGDEATCKRLSRKDGRVWLLPENPEYSPIDGTEATILGRVSAVVRKY
ncbi:MAG: transcriptional repressor LexA [Clostridia bacterium]|nr:transcriptional repressor LexA [Clostridia bacterium]